MTNEENNQITVTPSLLLMWQFSFFENLVPPDC